MSSHVGFLVAYLDQIVTLQELTMLSAARDPLPFHIPCNRFVGLEITDDMVCFSDGLAVLLKPLIEWDYCFCFPVVPEPLSHRPSLSVNQLLLMSLVALHHVHLMLLGLGLHIHLGFLHFHLHFHLHLLQLRLHLGELKL